MVDIFGKVFTMVKMAGKAKGTPRARRTFTDEFKAGAVGLVLRESHASQGVAHVVPDDREWRGSARGA